MPVQQFAQAFMKQERFALGPRAEETDDDESSQRSIGFLAQLGLFDKAPLAFGFGCLLGLSSPGFDFWWLAWIGLVPLLLLVQSCQASPRRHFDAGVISLLFGFGYYLVCLRWYLGLYPLSWLGLHDVLAIQGVGIIWILESAHQALLFLGFGLLLATLPMRAGFFPHFERPYFPYLISAPLIWVFFQWVIGPQEFFLGTPVNQLAYSQYQQPAIIQMAKLGGSQLLDIMIVITNCAIAAFLFEHGRLVQRLGRRVDWFSSKSGVAVDLFLVLLCVLGLSFWGEGEVTASIFKKEDQKPAVPIIDVAVLQGNVTIEDERLGLVTPAQVAATYAQLGTGLGASLLVLPEGVAGSVQKEPGMLLPALQQITAREKKACIVGIIETVDKATFNAAASLHDGSLKDPIYAKRRLVPFGEFFPGGFITGFLPQPVKHLLLGADQPFVKAAQLQLLNSVWGKVGTSICVEVIYPNLVAQEVRNGASLLVNLSNLAWFHSSSLNRQILACAQMRAVENGRYLVLSTNTGTSAVIDPCGTVVSQSIFGKRGVLLDRVQFLYKKTPFTKMWWL
jgi:apolipoprotein N-acyltransferase